MTPFALIASAFQLLLLRVSVQINICSLALVDIPPKERSKVPAIDRVTQQGHRVFFSSFFHSQALFCVASRLKSLVRRSAVQDESVSFPEHCEIQ